MGLDSSYLAHANQPNLDKSRISLFAYMDSCVKWNMNQSDSSVWYYQNIKLVWTHASSQDAAELILHSVVLQSLSQSQPLFKSHYKNVWLDVHHRTSIKICVASTFSMLATEESNLVHRILQHVRSLSKWFQKLFSCCAPHQSYNFVKLE